MVGALADRAREAARDPSDRDVVGDQELHDGVQRRARLGEDLVERDAAFEASERGTETEVDAVSEREVLTELAVNIEAIRVGPPALVAIRRADDEQHGCALGYDLAVHLHGFRHVAADLRAG